jgi:hypothetical protein
MGAKMQRLFVAMFVLVASTGAEAASPAQATRSCQRQDLIGTWSLARIEAQQAGVQEFYRVTPNEVMRFSPNGAFIYVARRAPYSASEARRSLDNADAVDGVSYAFQLQGEQLILLRDGVPFEGFRCSISLGESAQLNRGDLLLRNLVNRPGLLRIQRKLN